MNTRFAITILVTTLVLSACPSDENQPPTGEEVGDGDGDTATDDPGTDTEDECLGADGCFACEPSSSTELLNACTDASCEPFLDTPERLPLLERDGSLPPLP